MVISIRKCRRETNWWNAQLDADKGGLSLLEGAVVDS